MYGYQDLPLILPWVVNSTPKPTTAEIQRRITNTVFEVLKDIQESFPGDSERCKEFLQQMGEPQLLDDFLARHQQSLSAPIEDNLMESCPGDLESCKEFQELMGQPLSINEFLARHQSLSAPPEDNRMDCTEDSYYEDISDDDQVPSSPKAFNTGPSEEGSTRCNDDLQNESNDVPSQINDVSNQSTDETNTYHEEYLIVGHAASQCHIDRVKDKFLFSNNSEIASKPRRKQRHVTKSEFSTLSITETSLEVKNDVPPIKGKRGRPRGKKTSSYAATISGVVAESSIPILESSKETSTTSDNSAVGIEIGDSGCGSPLLSSTLTSPLIQPKRVDIRDLQQKRKIKSVSPRLNLESESKDSDDEKDKNSQTEVAVAKNRKPGVGVGRGRGKKLNFLQMLSTVGKKVIPNRVRGRPKKVTTVGLKSAPPKTNTNTWRQKQVKKALSISPKDTNRKDQQSFLSLVQNSIGDSPEYGLFIRSVSLLNEKSITSSVFLHLVYPHLENFPQLYNRLKDFLAVNETLSGIISTPAVNTELDSQTIVVDKLPKLGKSYRILPPHYVQPVCSGRTALCDSVINDKYICIPPDSRNGQSSPMSPKLKITNKRVNTVNVQTEDGCYEVDLMIEIGRMCLNHFEVVMKKMSTMSEVELEQFQLGELLGGSSQIIPSFILQLYGKEVGPNVIDALAIKPFNCVPVVLSRIKVKLEEWRDVQKNFNQELRGQVFNLIESEVSSGLKPNVDPSPIEVLDD